MSTPDDVRRPARHRLWIPLLALGLATSDGAAQLPGEVVAEAKISDVSGGVTPTLADGDRFGGAVTALGDLDNDGNEDIAVGAEADGDGGLLRGAVWILFLDADGTVKGHQKISDTAGGFTGTLDNLDGFGNAVAGLGDLDGDGNEDLAVGAASDDDGGVNNGAVWILFLDSDGSVKSHQKISASSGGFGGTLDFMGAFGRSVDCLGDHDGDGVVDIAVGNASDDDGGFIRGSTWIVFLDTDGTVKSEQKISGSSGGFTGLIEDKDLFGFAVSALGDLDGDGVGDLAVGAKQDDDGAPDNNNRGAVWIVFLNTDGTVKGQQKISDTEGGFTGVLDDSDLFGVALSTLGDVDGDGVRDLAVGAHNDDDGGTDRGAIWLLFLQPDGTVKGHLKVADGSGGLVGPLADGDEFGSSAAALVDLDGDGFGELVVGSPDDDDGGNNRGAVRTLFLQGVTWAHVGTGLAGAAGVPQLDGTGVLLPDERFTLSLQDGLPSGSAILVMGFSAIVAPFKGGVLVPALDLIVPGLPLDPLGGLALTTRWPSGVPTGAKVFFQYWIPDGAAVSGLAASNGLKATAP